MTEELKKAGLFFDDLYNLKILNPDIITDTEDLKSECITYAEKFQEFKKIVDEFVTIADNFGKEVEQEKLKALAAQTRLKTIAKQRENEEQMLQAEIMEKQVQFDRLKTELQYIQRIESEQQEIINSFYENQ